MKEISITNRNLSYGINVDDIFWVAQNILRREKVRESRDEELIADILGYMLTDSGSKPSSRAEFIDNYYGITEKQADKDRLRMVETNLAKRTPEIVTQQFMNVYEALKKSLYEADKKFNILINKDQAGVPRYFQAVFLAYYELLIEEDKIVQDNKKLASKLNGIGRHIHVYKGGGKWSAEDREKNIKAVKGIISTAFKNRGPNDPALNSWTTELENILMQSFTEQSLYDFKQGFYGLNDGIFNEKLFSKIIKTLTAMANYGPNVDGYVLVGIANDIGSS